VFTLRSWNHVEQAPADPILGVAEAFKLDPVCLQTRSSSCRLCSSAAPARLAPRGVRLLKLSDAGLQAWRCGPCGDCMPIWYFFFLLNSAVCIAQAEKKVNLGIGAYRDEAGKPWVLECVKAVSLNACVHHEFVWLIQ